MCFNLLFIVVMKFKSVIGNAAAAGSRLATVGAE